MPHRNEQIYAFCDHCKTYRSYVRALRAPDHYVHLFFSIVFFGLWLPIWAARTAYFVLRRASVPFQCARCQQPLVPARTECKSLRTVAVLLQLNLHDLVQDCLCSHVLEVLPWAALA